jgi:hypothetical protein
VRLSPHREVSRSAQYLSVDPAKRPRKPQQRNSKKQTDIVQRLLRKLALPFAGELMPFAIRSFH